MRRTIKDRYQYLESGLSNVVLDHMPVYECDCGEQVVGLPNVERLHALIFEKLLTKGGRLRGEEIRFLRKWMGVKGVDFAKMVKVDPTTLSKWESGDQSISKEHDQLIRFAIVVTLGARAKQQMAEAFRKISDQYLDLLGEIQAAQRDGGNDETVEVSQRDMNQPSILSFSWGTPPAHQPSVELVS
jgi:putative zinc finger/helix-turn-helix YgiT family protein